MPYMTKIVSVQVVLSVALIATPATADQKIKTKSNIKNDRAMAPAPAGTTGCKTGGEAFTWTAEVQAQGEAARSSTARTDVALDPAVCAGSQDAMNRINMSVDQQAALQAAVDSCDEAALRELVTVNGLSPELAAGADFHAINTKGTGCNNGRVATITGGAAPGLVISVGYDASTKRGYSLANWMYFHAK